LGFITQGSTKLVNCGIVLDIEEKKDLSVFAPPPRPVLKVADLDLSLFALIKL